MNKLKIALPMSAFLFAIVAVVATSFAKENSAATYYFKNESNMCQECQAENLPLNVQECQPENTGEICQCQLITPVSLGIDNTQPANDCIVVRRPIEP